MSRRAAWVIGTFDTKADELNYIGERIHARGVEVVTADVSTSASEESQARCSIGAREIAACHPGGEAAVFTGDRGSAVVAMAQALQIYLQGRDDIGGVIAAGGSGAAALVAPALQRLPIGLPKLLVTTLASGDVRAYVGSSDIATLYPVVDVSGLNRISRTVLGNAAHALAGMIQAWQPPQADALPALGLSMFGVTTPCVQAVAHALHTDFECLVFHATGTGGQSLEKLADDGQLAALLDLTTTEIADHLFGGVLSAGEDRLGSPARRALPYIGSCGALDMVNFWAPDTVPVAYRGRRLHMHNSHVTLMRTTPEENAQLGHWIAERLNRMQGPVRFLLPAGGVSALDAPGQDFWWPEADQALFDALEAHTRQTDQRRLVRVPAHINAAEFVQAVVQLVRELVPRH
ncbi:MAG: UPF0261 family protein [Comamonadaceae bacterium]|nr:MAG: UPF0261 family protein [Comamonadaceae bacterium]